MSEWKTYKLGDLISHKKGFAFKSNLYQKNGCPVIRVSNFTSNSISLKEILYIDNNLKPNFKDVELKTNDIVIATVGSWPNNPASIVGRVIKVPKEANASLLNQNAVIIYPNSKIDKSFLYYLLKQKDFSNYLISGAQGSANQASITLEQIYNYEFSTPEDQTKQQQIAQILTSLDDKIELNQQINQTLETLAQALFKEWFIDFNFKGFDGELVNGLPKGWKKGKLSSVCEIKYGKDHKHLSDGKIPVYGSGGIMRYADKALFEKESILIPRKGTLSNLFYVSNPFWSVDTMFYTIIKDDSIRKYLFYLLKTLNLASMNVGSAVPSLTTEVLNKIEIVIPVKEVLNDFENFISTLYKKMEENNNQIQTLIQTRDTLLPKLMSGKIEVKN